MSLANTVKKKNYHVRLFISLSAQLLFTPVGSCQDASLRSESDESLMSEEVLCVSEYAEDIQQHLRESEVRNDLNFEH